MPKIKTRRGAVKRFKAMKSGKIKRKRSRLRHILTSKSTKHKRELRGKAYVTGANLKAVRRMLVV